MEILPDEVGGEDCWRMMTKVGNRMNCQLRLEEGKLKAGLVMSTRMMPPPELLDLENSVSHLLSNLTDVQRTGELKSLKNSYGITFNNFLGDVLKILAGKKSMDFHLAEE